MKTINNYISEKLIIKKDKIQKYAYFPKYTYELINIIADHLKEQGPDADLNDISLEHITSLDDVFTHVEKKKEYLVRNIDISEWDVSHINSMIATFADCAEFDCDLSKWNMSNVDDIEGMFYGCRKFKGDGLDKWDVSNITDFRSAFRKCDSLNVSFDNWDINNKAKISAVFDNDYKNIPGWYNKQ